MFNRQRKEQEQKIRYAVVGLGWIAQEAVLPAFGNAENSELAALVSDDPVKLAELGRKYDVGNLYSYDRYDEMLASRTVDAVYIALPNSMHADYSIRALRAGVHVLCEKPMAVNAEEAQAMIDAANDSNAKLMIAYRLHFEEANLMAVEILQAGAIGDPRLISALNVQNVESGNVRLDRELGGGPVEDLGIYCINAARYLFQSEPIEVTAFAESSSNPRFREVPEMVSAILRFPENRMAQFTCGFGESKVSSLHAVGTLGDLKLEPAFSYSSDIRHTLTIGDKPEDKTYSARDQFAPLLIHLSDSILNDEPSEPSGLEGLTDMQIIDAIRHSIATAQAVKLDLPFRDYRPTMMQNTQRRAVRKPELVNAEAAGANNKK